MARKAPSTSKQNRRHRARTAARHSGKRQTPGFHEHHMMMWGTGRYDPDNDGDNDAAADNDAASAGATVGP